MWYALQKVGFGLLGFFAGARVFQEGPAAFSTQGNSAGSAWSQRFVDYWMAWRSPGISVGLPFENIKSSIYWSSTPSETNDIGAWHVRFFS